MLIISQATGQLKWVKNKAASKRQEITEALSNTEMLRKLTETLMKEEKEDSEEDVFRVRKVRDKWVEGVKHATEKIGKSEITNILNRLALEQLDNEMTLLDKFQ